MKIVELSLRRRVTVAMMAIALTLFGAVAFQRLPVNLLPDISYPSLTVETRYPGAAPAEVESLLTRPIEEAVGVVAGVERLTSVSQPGLSRVTLELSWDRDMDFAALDVRQKLDLVTLPEQAEKPVLLRFDPSNDPIQRLYVTSGGEATEEIAGAVASRAAGSRDRGSGAPDLFRLRYLAEEVLKKDLESVEGLAAVKVHGGFEEEIQVRVDEGKLALMDLSIEEVRDRLERENVNQAGGSLYEREARYLVRSRNELTDLDDVLGTILVDRDGRQVTLGDVAVVERGARQREVITRLDGEEAVELALYKEGDANTVAVARAVGRRLERVRSELPGGVRLVTGVDQSRFIQASIREVLYNALVGGAIAVLILLFFLKDLRSTLIVGVSIPLSVVVTFFLMYQTGTTLNIMSLGGLALGVGMLVDNAIVVLEAIHKRRERGDAPVEAARRGASEVGRAVAASTLTTVAVFLPVVFLEGIAAQLFLDQALTVSFALLASLAVALTVIPMLAGLAAGRVGDGEPAEDAAAPEAAITEATSSEAAIPEAVTAGRMARLGRALGKGLRTAGHAVLSWLPTQLLAGVRWGVRGAYRLVVFLLRPAGRLFDRGMDVLAALYPKVLGWALDHRWVVVGAALVAFGLTVSLVPSLGLDLIPPMSQGEFAFKVGLPQGTPLAVTDRHLARVSDAVAEDPRVESVAALAGGAGLSLARAGTEGENAGRIQVRMAPGTTPAQEEAVAELLRAELEGLPEARFELERPQVFTFRTPVEVEVYGDRLEDLHTASARLAERMDTLPGVVDLQSSAELGNPELQITFDRSRLARMGLDLARVAATVRTKVQGEVATRLTQGDREIDIRVQAVEAGHASVAEVENLIIGHRTPRGTVELASLTGDSSQRAGDENGAGRDGNRQAGQDSGGRGQAEGGGGSRDLDGFGSGDPGSRERPPRVPILLKTVADVRVAEGPSEIRRLGQRRAAVLSGNLAGRDMGAVARDLEEVLASEVLPLGVTAAVGGQHEEMARALESLLMALALAAFLVYLVMASQFESFLHPFVILFTLPLGAIGVVGSLWLTGHTLNVVALIGAVMLAGIVVNNAIVLVDAVNRFRREEGLDRRGALLAAGSERLRPILMTSATTICGLLPMALGLGEGAELRAPLAITVIGGLTVGTVLTLVVIPVVYSLLDRRPLADASPAAAADPGPTLGTETAALPAGAALEGEA